MEMSAIPSCVPPNQTQPRSPLRSGMMLAAWFCTQGEGRKVSARTGSSAGWLTRPDLSMTGAGCAVAGMSKVLDMDFSLVVSVSAGDGRMRRISRRGRRRVPAKGAFDAHDDQRAQRRDVHVVDAIRIAEHVPDGCGDGGSNQTEGRASIAAEQRQVEPDHCDNGDRQSQRAGEERELQNLRNEEDE